MIPATLDLRAMGSAIRAVVDAEASALDAVAGWFAGWEATLSRFRDDSALAVLNREGVAAPAAPALLDVVEAALAAAALTDGLVTPTVLAAVRAAGYDRSFDQGLDLAAPVVAAAVASWRAIELDRPAARIALPPGVGLDLGGVAKGWAADQAAARLAVHGPALVSAGGDVAVSGPRADGDAWLVDVVDPRHPAQSGGSPIAQLVVERGGVATSGRDRRRWTRAGAPCHHLIDPRTGRPAETDVLSATVVGPSAQRAEAAAKAVLLLGAAAGLAWLESHQLVGLVILDDGTLRESRGLAPYRWA